MICGMFFYDFEKPHFFIYDFLRFVVWFFYDFFTIFFLCFFNDFLMIFCFCFYVFCIFYRFPFSFDFQKNLNIKY